MPKTQALLQEMVKWLKKTVLLSKLVGFYAVVFYCNQRFHGLGKNAKNKLTC